MFFAKCPGYLLFRSSNSDNLTLQLHSLLIVVYFCIVPKWYLRACIRCSVTFCALYRQSAAVEGLWELPLRRCGEMSSDLY